MADINESESKIGKETKICFECEDKASYNCLECKNSLCIDCYKPHLKKKETKHHTLTPLESESKSKTDYTSPPLDPNGNV